jgi:hypothetical protein
VSNRPPAIPGILASQCHYLTDLLGGESGGLPRAGFINQNLFDEPCKNALIIIVCPLSGIKTR